MTEVVWDFRGVGGEGFEDAILNLAVVAGSLTLLVEVSHIPQGGEGDYCISNMSCRRMLETPP